MPTRARIRRVLALAVALLLLGAGVAHADRAAYERVDAAYTAGGGQLDACAFSQAELESALDGIPPAFRAVVLDLRRAIEDGIEQHRSGGCEGVATTPSTTPTTPAAGATPPPPAAAGPVTTPSVQPPGVARDRTPLLVGLAAVGALALLALLAWAWARWRGWDPAWAARARHAWGEAAYRATSTWSEFADWLRLGR